MAKTAQNPSTPVIPVLQGMPSNIGSAQPLQANGNVYNVGRTAWGNIAAGWLLHYGSINHLQHNAIYTAYVVTGALNSLPSHVKWLASHKPTPIAVTYNKANQTATVAKTVAQPWLAKVLPASAIKQLLALATPSSTPSGSTSKRTSKPRGSSKKGSTTQQVTPPSTPSVPPVTFNTAGMPLPLS